MFKKWTLKHKINKCQRRIDILEIKRTESQTSLVDSYLKKTSPNDQDIDLFNQYTQEIEQEKNKLQELIDELKQIDSKD